MSLKAISGFIRQYFIITLFVAAFPCLVRAQCRLEIEIEGLRNDSGVIMLQVLRSDRQVAAEAKGTPEGNRTLIAVDGLKPGRYGVRYYHDENLSGQMETNRMGKPVEGYGFSNNVTGLFRPPAFDKWLFDLSGNKKITLKPVY